MCIGYPKEATIFKPKQSAFESIYSGDFKNWNIITKGFIYDNPPNSNFFSASIFTYHGFSGGPVILNGRLIGLVSGFGFDYKESNSILLNKYFVYHPYFIKATLIYKYLKEFDSRIH